eukprot:3295199-Rhodomonas_salina.1
MSGSGWSSISTGPPLPPPPGPLATLRPPPPSDLDKGEQRREQLSIFLLDAIAHCGIAVGGSAGAAVHS